MDPPFRMVQFDDVFSTRPLSINRPPVTASYSRSSYSSALAGPPTIGQAPTSGHNSVSMPPPKSRFGPDLQSPIVTPIESPQSFSADYQKSYLAAGVEAPTSGDQVPVVRLPF